MTSYWTQKKPNSFMNASAQSIAAITRSFVAILRDDHASLDGSGLRRRSPVSSYLPFRPHNSQNSSYVYLSRAAAGICYLEYQWRLNDYTGRKLVHGDAQSSIAGVP